MPPFKSEAQRRKFGELVKQGKMSQDTFNEWNSQTPKKIPERLSPKPQKITTVKQLETIGKRKSRSR